MKWFLEKWTLPAVLWGAFAFAMIYLERWMWIVVGVICGWFSARWLNRYRSCPLPRRNRRPDG